MAKDSSSTILVLGAVALAYWGYTQGWFSSLFPGATSTPPVPPATPSTPASAPTSTPAAPTYSGLSLSQMFSELSAAEAKSFGGDPALSCAGAGGSGNSSQLANLESQLSAAQAQVASGNVSAVGTVAQLSVQIAQLEAQMTSGPAPTSCSDPIATSDVHNWYLVNRTSANVPDGLLPGGGDPIPLSQYWASVTPLLQQHFPGLSGAEMYAGLGAIARGWRR